MVLLSLTRERVLVRIGYVLVTILTGFVPGVVAYAVLSFIIPSKDS